MTGLRLTVVLLNGARHVTRYFLRVLPIVRFPSIVVHFMENQQE